MALLKRKVDGILADWKARPGHKPLVIKGARQVGKTESVRAFGRTNYHSVIEIGSPGKFSVFPCSAPSDARSL